MASTGNGAPSLRRSTEALAPLPPPVNSSARTTAKVSCSGQWSISLLRSTHHDGPQRMPVLGIGRFRSASRPRRDASSALQRRLGDLLVGGERRGRLEAVLLEAVVIGPYPPERGEPAPAHPAHIADEGRPGLA